MGLAKSTPWRFGIDINYWSIGESNINWNEHRAHVVLSGYRSRELKLAGDIPVENVGVDFSPENFVFHKGANTEQEFYTWVKEFMWPDAVDVLEDL